jgi:cytochrome c oxidase assembly protein subunit 15
VNLPAPVRAWLVLLLVMIAAMVAIGGITRLTESGLSMVTWEPILGAKPPLDEAEWQARFDQYRQFPEFQQKKSTMTLAEFKQIFFWEYLHRLWGRLIGLVYLLPFAWWLIRRKLERRLAWLLAGGFALICLQGYAGWFMVQSGLLNRPAVSHIRLAIHLVLAFLLAAYLWRILLRPAPAAAAVTGRTVIRLAALAGLVLLAVQIVYGAFVAGLDAGLVSSTWPLMQGHLVPDGLWSLKPFNANLHANPLTVHFLHRWLGLLVAASVGLTAWLAWRTGSPALRRPAAWTAALVLAQFLLGVATVLLHVAIPVAVLHQVNALALLLSLLGLYFAAKGSPAPDTQPRHAAK